MLEFYLHQFGLAFMAFFAIMNPISSLPVYLSLTDGDDRKMARAVARKGLIIAFIIVLVFAFAGRFIFEMFGITLPALRIAGGILVFLIGFHMVQGNRSPMHRTPASAEPQEDRNLLYQEKMNVAISPLGTPLLAGPGTIATAMNLSAGDSLTGTVIVVGAFSLLCLITYTLFLFGAQITRLLGKNVMNVVTRMMGLILAVIGTQMLVAGLKGAFPILAGKDKSRLKTVSDGLYPVIGIKSQASSGFSRHKTNNLPMCCTSCASVAAHKASHIAMRSARSSPKTRTLINSCAVRAASVSLITDSVRPCWPIMTTGLR